MGGEIYRGGKYMLLETMKDNYLEYVKVNLTKGTYEFYKVHLNYLVRYFKSKNIINSDEINKKILNDYILFERNCKVSNATINKRIMALKQLFKLNNISNKSIEELKKFKEEKRRFNVLTNNELNRLVEYLNSNVLKEKNKLLIYILIDTGARINEVLHIKKSNINFLNNTIYLETTKTHVPRMVPFTNATLFLLKDFMNRNNNSKDDNLFDMTISGVESLFCRIAKRLHLNKFHPHMLRHTLATKLHRKGVSLMIIQKIMGHANVSTTERYIHVDIDDVLYFYNQVME